MNYFVMYSGIGWGNVDARDESLARQYQAFLTGLMMGIHFTAMGFA